MSARKGKHKRERSNSFAPESGPVPGAHRPPEVAWRQQNLPGKLFVLTPANIVTLFFIIGCAFLPCGIFIVNQSTDVVEVIQRYDKACENQTVCQINITIPANMFPPVYVYYQLTDFFQNHRRYVTSRSDPQLMGTVGSRGGCASVSEYNGSTIVPCGLIANSFFNDTLTATACGTEFNSTSCKYLVPLSDDWSKDEIAWSSDSKKFSYKDPAANGATSTSIDGPPHVLPRVDDPDLWVWMRTSGMSTLRKLYRIIKNRKLPKDSVLSFTIVNNFPVKSFSGSKSVVVTTMNWLGAKNPFLGWLFIGVACWCLFCGIAGLIKMAVSPRQLGDMRFFKWEVLPPTQAT